MFCSVLKNVSEVFAFGFGALKVAINNVPSILACFVGNRKTFKSFNAPRCSKSQHCRLPVFDIIIISYTRQCLPQERWWFICYRSYNVSTCVATVLHSYTYTDPL